MGRLVGENSMKSTTSSTLMAQSASTSDSGTDAKPGDGVCPSASSLQAIFDAAHDLWSESNTETDCDRRTEMFDVNMFLHLMTNNPTFRPPRLEDVTAPGNTPTDLIVDLEMSLETCSTPNCEQRKRTVPSYLLIGRSIWNTYDAVSASNYKSVSAGLTTSSIRSLTRLVLAWSHILSCRWVEILRDNGENALLLQPETCTDEEYWEMIRGEQWEATVSHQDKLYFAPFMLRSNSALAMNMSVSLRESRWSLALTRTQNRYANLHGMRGRRLSYHAKILHVPRSVIRMCSRSCYCALSYITRQTLSQTS